MNDYELKQQVEKIHAVYCQAALVEEYIEGRDISASVIGNGSDAIVLPLSEIVYTDYSGPKMLSFISKWSSDPCDYVGITVECPCALNPKTQAMINEIALRATRVMGCRDYTRVDFRLRGNTPLVLEVNANPCLNPDNAGFILSANACGYSYEDIVAKILEDSIRDRLQAGTHGG
jgi:D-alanine-D-alanine ligase